MSYDNQVRSATKEDLERLYGSERLPIGFPVQPSADDEPEAEPEHEPDEQQA